MSRHAKRLLRKSKQPAVRIAKRATSFYALIFAALFAGVGTYVIMSSFAATGPTANLWIVPSGGSSNCTRQSTPTDLGSAAASAKCNSMQAADNAASNGDMVRFQAGTYGNQSLVATTKTVSFIGTGSDTVLGSVSFGSDSSVQANKVSNKTLDSFAGKSGTFIGANSSTIKNGSLTGASYIESSSYLTFDKIDFNGNHTADDTIDVYEQDRAYQANDHITFTRSQIHGARASVASSHPDGIQFCNCSTMAGRGDSFHATNITISYTKFYDNECINVRTNPGTGLDMIGNVFNASVNGLSGCNSYIADVIGAGGTMAYNTFLDGQPIQNNESYNNPMQRWTGNVGAGVGYSGCQVKNAVWTRNVWTEQKCSATDKLTTTANLKLNADGSPQAGSPVIDAGDGSGDAYNTTAPIATGSYPGVDYNGNARFSGTAPDAGAFEYGADVVTANLWMDPDGGSCTYSSTAAAYDSAKACDSFTEACANLPAGQTMLVKGGTYTSSETQLSNCKPASKITMKVAPGEKATTTYIGAQDTNNVQIEGFYDDMSGNGNGPGSYFVCTQNVTLKNVEIEGDHSQGTAYGDAVQVWPRDQNPVCHNQNFKLDGVFIHDLHTYVAAQDNHTDCVQAASSQGLTIINSRLVNCGTQSFQLNDDAWPCANSGCASLTNVDLENNWIGMGGTIGGLTNLTVKNNSFAETPNFATAYNKGTVVMTGNIFNLPQDYHCQVYSGKGVATSKTFSYNLTNVNCPAGTNSIKVANLGSLFVNYSYSNSSTWNMHLAGSNAAVDAMPANLAPATDYDGDVRPQGANADIGADEYGGSGGGTADTTAPTVTLTAPASGSTLSGASINLTANASDNVGVSSVEFYVDGNLVGTDNASPWSFTWDSRSVSNGTHTITAKAYDVSNNSKTSAAVTVSTNNTNVCYVSSTDWKNTSFASKTGTFTFDFDATPNATGLDAVTGVSSGTAITFSDLAAAVRFNDSNKIDVRNGSTYTALTSVSYTPGTSYHFKMTVDVANHTYSVDVTPNGGSKVTLATNYSFRTEQASVSSLNNWAIFSDSGTHTVCNGAVAASSGGTPKAGDFNGDGVVNIYDMGIMLSKWLSTNATAQDLNNDGIVNIYDLGIFLSNYGT